MAVQRKKNRKKPEPLLGAQAFGQDGRGRTSGASAFGSGDDETPLRGVQAFGQESEGKPTGAASIGGADDGLPLRGALLVGNRPDGGPTGATAFGGAEDKMPVKGALRFGNDPQGGPTGALAFGNPTTAAQFLGAQAFGAAQLVPSKLYKDEIGYDFGATLLITDEASMAGIRKDPRDRLRKRILAVLDRLLAMDVERMRHGLDEDSIKWGRLKDPDTSLDRELAAELRCWYRKAPGERLGMGHLRDLLEQSERLHSFDLICSWDRSPVTLSVRWGGEIVASAETRYHKEHTFFEFRDLEGTILGYADTLVPRRGPQRARVRGVDGVTVGTLQLDTPGSTEEIEPGKKPKISATILDARDEPLFRLEEKQSTPKLFLAELKDAASDEPIGRLEDRPADGNIKCSIEIDISVPQVLAWALASMMADLARRTRDGWPEAPSEQEQELPSVEEALGPRKRRSRPDSEG